MYFPESEEQRLDAQADLRLATKSGLLTTRPIFAVLMKKQRQQRHAAEGITKRQTNL